MTTYEIIKWVESQVNGIGHSDRHFMEHLFGTYDILRSWGEDKGLCYAGLCHSLYETAYFKSDALRGKITRQQLADIIGSEPEYLVYLFCKMPNRTSDIMNNEYKLPEELHLPLLKLELANFIEQMNDIPWTTERKKQNIQKMIDLIKGIDNQFELKESYFDNGEY